MVGEKETAEWFLCVIGRNNWIVVRTDLLFDDSVFQSARLVFNRVILWRIRPPGCSPSCHRSLPCVSRLLILCRIN